MSVCPICGRVYCDHTPEERGQTFEEMMDLPPKKKKQEDSSKNKE